MRRADDHKTRLLVLQALLDRRHPVAVALGEQPIEELRRLAERAEQIARMLGDNKQWHSHGRMIGPATLTRLLRLEINDYSADDTLRPLVRSYNDLLTDYIARGGFTFFMHNRDIF